MRTDPEFSSHAAAELSPNIRSFLGVPIMLSDGTFYGTLCAVDPEPQRLSHEQAKLLVVLARFVATQIERQRGKTPRHSLVTPIRLRNRSFGGSEAHLSAHKRPRVGSFNRLRNPPKLVKKGSKIWPHDLQTRRLPTSILLSDGR